MTAEQHTRRTVLVTGAAVAGVAAGTAALSACATDDSPPAAAGGGSLVALADVPVGEAKAVKSGDQEIIVARPTDATAVAFSAVCTHQGCAVKAEGKDLTCPCHGSVFDALTGQVRQGPAETPLPAVAVKVENGQVLSA